MIQTLTSQRLAIALLVVSLLLFGAGVCFKFSAAQLAPMGNTLARARMNSSANTLLAASLGFMILRVSLAIVRVVSVVASAAKNRNGRQS